MIPESEAKLGDVLRSALALPASQDVTTASQATVETWDSLAHVMLMLALEGEFGVTIDLADQLELNTYDAIRSYLEKHAPGERGA